MKDIVKRMRFCVGTDVHSCRGCDYEPFPDCWDRLVTEGADEIEKLRKKCKRLKERSAEKTGVFIEGMQMPKSCSECRFAVDGWCYAYGYCKANPEALSDSTRPEWCPLKELEVLASQKSQRLCRQK